MTVLPKTTEAEALETLTRIKDNSKGPSGFMASRSLERVPKLKSSDDLVGKICDRLAHMNHGDLSTAERQIVGLLIDAGWLKKTDDGEIVRP